MMKIQLVFLSFAALTSALGQAPGRTSATDTANILNSLVKSQIVEFKSNLRRDPFVVPSDNTNTNTEFLIDEITIKGKVVVRKTPFAIILDSFQHVLEIPVGYKFLDGELIEITDSALVFSQWDANSADRSVRRTVTKVFMREGEK